jgi:transposase
MFSPSAGVSDSDWEATPPAVRVLLEQLINRVAQLEEQKSRSSRNSSKPPSSDGYGFKPPANEQRKGRGRKRGGQDGHPGASRNLLPVEQCGEVISHFPDNCRGLGEALSGEDSEPHRHQVIEIPKIEPFVIEHQLHRLICSHCCHTTTPAVLPAGGENPLCQES